MKKSIAGIRGNFVLILTLMGISGLVAAHVQNGTIADPGDAFVGYTVVCSEGDSTTKLVAQVNDVLPVKPPRLLITVGKDGKIAYAIDSTDGDGNYSAFAEVQGGEGNYNIWVSKLPSTKGGDESTRAGSEAFVMQFHCMTGSNPQSLVHTATDIYYNSKPSPVPNPNPEGGGVVTPPVNKPNPSISSSKLQVASGAISKKMLQSSYIVQCSANSNKQDTVRYKFKIKAASKNRTFGVRLAVKSGSEEVIVEDLIPGDGGYSEFKSIDGGNGAYQLTVSKSPIDVDVQKSMVFGIQHVCETDKLTRGKLVGPKKQP